MCQAGVARICQAGSLDPMFFNGTGLGLGLGLGIGLGLGNCLFYN